VSSRIKAGYVKRVDNRMQFFAIAVTFGFTEIFRRWSLPTHLGRACWPGTENVDICPTHRVNTPKCYDGLATQRMRIK
jgi:hypothetical protein